MTIAERMPSMNRRELLTLPLLGAAAAGTGALSLPGAALAAPVKIPLIWQTQLEDYWCGPASLRIASSAWFDEDEMPGQRELANHIGTDSNGSTRHQMLYGTEYIFGRYVYELEDVKSRGAPGRSRRAFPPRTARCGCPVSEVSTMREP
ncbi:C39 family peptidase [Actinoplanes sp. NPDC048796]|uniref:C39 family peptidase n=1 Tax=Actinoplanes sp. NPDC048796 TaxID=3155640 RepID=UPI0033F4F67C